VGPVALDTNVVIGFLDPDDPHHREAATLLGEHRDAPISMSAIAFSESLVHAIEHGREDRVQQFVVRAGVEIVPFDGRLAHDAAALRARLGSINLADAGVLATALDRGARLLTFDQALERARDRA
jgi:predicted nucleic acid-binding protein